MFTCLQRASACILTLSIVALLAPVSVQAGETINAIGITMVDIPAGSFLMGSGNNDTDANENETPQHNVTLNAFKLGKTEVTLGQYKKFLEDTKSILLKDTLFNKYNNLGDDFPVVRVNWHDAQLYIHWLNTKYEDGYRLPSEAEWEYACRAGGRDTYCGGNDLDTLAWYDGTNKNQHFVRGKKANAWGLYDMSGNVWEWVQDCYHEDYKGAPVDGSARFFYICNARVLRGGSWDSLARYNRAAYRGIYTPDTTNYLNGFRLAWSEPIKAAIIPDEKEKKAVEAPKRKSVPSVNQGDRFKKPLNARIEKL
jgi:formylglycine-generating enzyme required for sulfatase activity